MIKIFIKGTPFLVPEGVASYIETLEKENSKSYKKELFTPERAQEILNELNASDETRTHNQRGRKPVAVKGYRKDMENGNWIFCGDSIKFDVDGYCVDGQQRLNAIVESRVPQEFIVVRDLPLEAKRVIDSGFKKTVEDYLKSAEKAYQIGATAIVRQVNVFIKRGKNCGHSAGNLGLTNTDIIDVYNYDKEWYNRAANYGAEISKQCKALKKTEVGAIFFYLVRICGEEEEKVRNFFQNLYMAGVDKNTIYSKTNAALIQKDCRGSIRIDLYIKCWNNYVTYKKKDVPEEVKNSDWFITTTIVKNQGLETFAASALE